MAKSVKVVMGNPAEKKSVVRYFGPEDGALTSAYISKEALKKLGNPSEIVITIEAGEE